MTFIPSSYEEITCREVGRESTFEVCICAGLDRKVSNDELFEAFSSLYIPDMNPDEAIYSDWLATLLLDVSAEKLVKGYLFLNRNNDPFSHISIWENKNDPTSILQYECRIDEGKKTLANCEQYLEEEAVENLNVAMDDFLSGLELSEEDRAEFEANFATPEDRAVAAAAL